MSAGSITALVETLVVAGCTPDMILAAVRTAEAAKDASLEESKEGARARWRKWKSNQTNVGKRLQPLANDSKRLVRADDAPATEENKQTNKEERKQDTAPVARSDLVDFKSELSSLDTERVEAIVKHRRSKHGQLTGLSARLFVADAKACGLSLSDAVDTCISRNWITVKPEYLAGRRRQSATAPPAHQGDGYNAVLNKIINGKSDEYAGPTIDASYDRADSGGPTNLVQLNAFPKGH